MAFTRAWDNAFPPDTQLAKLGAQDIRENKEDTAERMQFFGSGALANRPTPEAVFGAPGNGVIYYAEDVGVLYRWDGTSWLDVRYDFTISDIALTAIPTGVETPANTVVLPAGSFKAGCKISIHGTVTSQTTPSATNRLRLYIQNVAPVFEFSWADAAAAAIMAELIVLDNGGYKATFIGIAGVAAATSFLCPDEQPFDVLNPCSIGTTLEVASGTGVATGLIAKVCL